MLTSLRFVLNHPLNRDRKLRALARYARWQVGTRVLRMPAVAPLTDHARLVATRGMTGATGNVYCGLHEFEDMAFVLHFLRPGDLFADVGANIGSYTVLAAKVCGARAVAAEPVPETFDRLLDNLAVNRLGDLATAVRTGVGREPGVLRFTRGLDTTNHVVPAGEPAAADAVECPVARLDDLLAGAVPAFVKVDVEGFEAEVLAGGARTFAAPGLHGVLMETNASGERYGAADADLHRTMAGFGFRPHRYHPFDRRLEPLPAPPAGGNTLYLRDTAFAADRVRTARPVSVYGRPL